MKFSIKNLFGLTLIFAVFYRPIIIPLFIALSETNIGLIFLYSLITPINLLAYCLLGDFLYMWEDNVVSQSVANDGPMILVVGLGIFIGMVLPIMVIYSIASIIMWTFDVDTKLTKKVKKMYSDYQWQKYRRSLK